MNNKKMLFALPLVALVLASGLGEALAAAELIEPDFYKDDVQSGKLPAIGERVPESPFVVPLEDMGKKTGRYGGSLRILGGSAKDTRLMVVYGYARLVGYNEKFEFIPDIAERIDVVEQRIFTFHLRKGHRWSDGQPFTTEDFRYYWEDIATNAEASRMGLPQELLVDGQPPVFEILDQWTVRYSWQKPNPFFLPALAGPSPIYIFRPAHYLKQFHATYTDPEVLQKKVKEEGQRNWVALHFRHDRPYKNQNPDRPTLQPWMLTTPPPSDRFIFKRNPYYHRIDTRGHQLPYIDTVAMSIASAKLIAAKTGSGEVDLQGRYLSLSNYTFLKQGEKRSNFTVRRWQSAKGAKIALFPNLNVSDPVWRTLFRKANFRRALSLAINRHDINQVIYYGLGLEGNNTVLPRSPLSQPSFRTKWASYDPALANAMLDELGLAKRNDDGIRLLADGREMEIIVETAGEDIEQTDILDLIRDDWLKVGIKLFSKPLQREVFRRRIFSGAAMMSVWGGLENAIPTFGSSPAELAPTRQQQLQWSRWGQYYETRGRIGEAPDIAEAQRLLTLNKNWISALKDSDKVQAWQEMLEIHADQMFTIGLVAGVSQLVVVSNRLRNVPEVGVYNWDPGSMFGIYRPDTFWYATKDGQ